ncbi:dipeptidyl aminopeptidase/acylaminoacyl peptidase [Pedobacter sp. UYEF25]
MNKRLTILFLFVATFTYAQKKPLDHSVYDAWESIGSKGISNNGIWASYTVTPQEGNAVLYFSNIKENKKLNYQRGVNVQFSYDSKFAAFLVRPFFSDLREAKIKKKKPESMPKDSLAILNLQNGVIMKIAAVKSFKMPEEGSGIIAYLMEKPDTAKVKTEQKSEGKDATIIADETSDSKKKDEGSDLIVKNLITQTQNTYKFITDYEFSKNGKQLVFVRKGNKKDKAVQPGVFMLNTEKNTVKTLVNGKGTFKNFVFDDDGEHLAFVGEQSPEKQEIKDYNIYFNSLTIDTAQIMVDYDMPGLPQKWSVSGDGKITFSEDGKKLFFGIAPIKQMKDTTLVDFEHAKVDIWTYKDDYLQPMQLKNAEKERKRSYLSAVEVYSADPKVMPLTDLKLPEATLINEGDSPYVLASTDYGRRIESQWKGNTLTDYYLVNTSDGRKKKIIDTLSGNASASPAGKYVLYFDEVTSNWFTYNIENGKKINLTGGMNVKFADEENDVPNYANSYGFATWTEDDKAVLIYDKYDIWSFDPDGKEKPKNISNGLGRNSSITFRYEKTTSRSERKKDNFIKNNETIWLNAFNNSTKEDGFYTIKVNSTKNPELVIMAKAKFTNLLKAKDADEYLFDRESYIESPNVYATSDFKTIQKLSETNPKQQNYNWGTTALVKWTTPKGHSSQGILYKPENFDASKKYPMIVYFYEKLSDGLYAYQAPAPTPSRLNISFFVSNGYLVFAPDISYETGHPGNSATDYIDSGVEMLKKNSWVDGSKIGLQGQSWGGYQVAYLITQTNRYAAAWAGAPVVNMTSAYGGIRWASGMNRQFQYEKTQSRIGATLWEKPELYIENSPLFMLPKVTTPVAIMSNDGDGSVPWYQGIEMFTGLKRLGKKAWLLNYNGDEHNLMLRQNRKDIQIREKQFFDYYLKGDKAPVWMVDGIPATEKGKTWGFELTDGKP